MTAQQLKNSILQMAVQGKLVPQDPNDEPASVLLERIRAEKEQLIKEKKIKREKAPSVIFRGPDNIPYEKVGDTVTPLEVPFDIPDSWEWMRLNNLTRNIFAGGDKPNDFSVVKDIEHPYPVIANGITNDGILGYTRTATAPKGTITVAGRGTIGFSLYRDYDYYPVVRLIVIEQSNYISPQYLQYVLEALPEKSLGTSIPQLTVPMLKPKLVPLPPLKEQYRIVAKIEELMPILEKYGDKESELSDLNSTFPDQLKKSILQQAIQGKLVPQDSADEPASVLLERIRAEKQRLIKEGKLKKDKHESIIFRRDNSHYEIVDGVERCIDEELPFEIPESWAWCRIGSAFSLQAGKNVQATEIKETIFEGAFLCYGGNGIRGYIDHYNREGDYPLIGRQGALCGNVNRAMGRFYATEHAVCVETFCNINVGWACLFLRALNLNQYATSTAQPGLAVANINQIFIPVPPLSEQRRIVTKIEELLSLIQSI